MQGTVWKYSSGAGSCIVDLGFYQAGLYWAPRLDGKYYLLLPVCSVYSSVCLWLVVMFFHPFSSGPEVGFYISCTKMTGRDVYQ